MALFMQEGDELRRPFPGSFFLQNVVVWPSAYALWWVQSAWFLLMNLGLKAVHVVRFKIQMIEETFGLPTGSLAYEVPFVMASKVRGTRLSYAHQYTNWRDNANSEVLDKCILVVNQWWKLQVLSSCLWLINWSNELPRFHCVNEAVLIAY